ncbi:MAG: ribosome maturation factor RimP [Oscillospiraceae bacterium]|nr:ribosome maturation factor RimP [Oscillospiraceae bacterium]
MSRATEKIFELAKPVVEEEGCSLWDVEYVREAGTWYLRIYIDKADGVSISDCERISRRMDPILDETDPFAESYTFEVCSAGAERELKRPSDFAAFLGHQVEVKLYKPLNGSKSFVGQLLSYENGEVSILAGGSEMRFTPGQIAQVRLRISNWN